MTPEEYDDEVFRADWWVCVDDEIGGYQIRTEPGPSSAGKGIEVASFISPTVAEYIVNVRDQDRGF